MDKQRFRDRYNPTTEVDIVLPVYGEASFLAACLASLKSYDAGCSYKVVLVDDCGPEQEKLQPIYEQSQAIVVRHPKNRGFAAACNTGARKGQAPWILLLNTDTLITHDGWLKAMVDEGADPKVGVVGALLTFFPELKDSAKRPGGKVQHAGVVFDIMGRPYHIFAGWSADHPKVNQRREMNCVTGACLLTSRQLWRRLGGLDTDYTKGNFEDVQYCIQARLAGFKVVFTPKAHLHHFAGGSNNVATADRNARLFQLKMGKLVEYDEWRFW